MARTKTDEELQKLLDEASDEEHYMIMIGMFPHRWSSLKMDKSDFARLMELNPRGHL